MGFNTSCISYGASAAAVADALDALDYVDDLGGSTVVREGDGSSQYNYGFVYYISASNSSESLAGSVDMELAGSGVEHGCARVSTLGYWNEPDNWDTGVTPTSADEASSTRTITSLSHVVNGATSYRKKVDRLITHSGTRNFLQVFRFLFSH